MTKRFTKPAIPDKVAGLMTAIQAIKSGIPLTIEKDIDGSIILVEYETEWDEGIQAPYTHITLNQGQITAIDNLIIAEGLT